MGKKNLKYQSPGINEGTRFEKLHTVTFDNSEIASNLIAREICDLVKLKQEKGISGIVRSNLVYRSRDAQGRVDREYSCLEINFKS